MPYDSLCYDDVVDDVDVDISDACEGFDEVVAILDMDDTVDELPTKPAYSIIVVNIAEEVAPS